VRRLRREAARTDEATNDERKDEERGTTREGLMMTGCIDAALPLYFLFVLGFRVVGR
jgi:hypothetical protein